jgi:hypothetical protein
MNSELFFSFQGQSHETRIIIRIRFLLSLSVGFLAKQKKVFRPFDRRIMHSALGDGQSKI